MFFTVFLSNLFSRIADSFSTHSARMSGVEFIDKPWYYSVPIKTHSYACYSSPYYLLREKIKKWQPFRKVFENNQKKRGKPIFYGFPSWLTHKRKRAAGARAGVFCPCILPLRLPPVPATRCRLITSWLLFCFPHNPPATCPPRRSREPLAIAPQILSAG